MAAFARYACEVALKAAVVHDDGDDGKDGL
jgi:hypothetical protein